MILVVDDYRDSAEALTRLLRSKGYPAQAVSGGPEALATIRTHPPEQPILVILDEMMPQMTGVETLRLIRSDPKISSTPVMFYTAGFDIPKRDEAMTLGALAWMFKGSVSTIDLEMTLREIGRLYEHVGGARMSVQD